MIVYLLINSFNKVGFILNNFLSGKKNGKIIILLINRIYIINAVKMIGKNRINKRILTTASTCQFLLS